MMMKETVLAVDIGTTSLKAGLITAEGEVVAFAKYKFISHNDRFIANHWMIALQNCLKHILKNKPETVITALGISGNGPTIVSESGLTLRWNEEYQVCSERCGGSLFIPRLIAFKELFQKEYSRTKMLFSGPEFLIYKMTGNAVTILPEKRYVQAYWDKERLENLKTGVEFQKLAPMKMPGENLGKVLPEIINFLGIKKYVKKTEVLNSEKQKKDFISELPVYSCGPDFIAALIGTGTISPGKLCDRSGSSEGFNFCIEKPVPCEGLRLLPSCIPGYWNISALLTVSSTLSEKNRLEKIKNCVESLRKYAKDNGFVFPDEMTVTGGQTLNQTWMTKKAEALKMKLAVCSFSNSELLGDACTAWYGLGKYQSLQEAAEKIVVKDKIYEGL